MKITDRTGKVAGGTIVTDEDEVMFMTSTGQSVRIPVSSVSQLSRSAQGVKRMSLNEGETIQDLAKVVQFEGDGEEDSEDEGAEIEDTANGEGESSAEGAADEQSEE